PDGDTLTYAWDLDGDGTFETSGENVTFSAANLDGPTSRTIKVRVTDQLGLFSESTAMVDVQNVAPTLNAINLSATTILENGVVEISGSINDPGLADSQKVVISWGDGSADVAIDLAAGIRNFTAKHQYLDDNPTNTPVDS